MEWGDAHAGSRWVHRSESLNLHEALTVTWVGYVIGDDEKGITLSFGYDENDNLAGTMFVLRGMIRKITKVRY